MCSFWRRLQRIFDNLSQVRITERLGACRGLKVGKITIAMSDKIKCAIIGYGKMGKIRAKAIEESGKGTVVAVCDDAPVVDRNSAMKRSLGEIISDPEVEAIFVCTPNYLIAPLSKQCLDAGKHVFAEKPPAFTATELEGVLEAEKNTNKVLMYGFNHRHHKSIECIKRYVMGGELGRILWMRGRYGKEVDKDYFSGWRADPRMAGGGIFLDQGIHMLDLFIYLAGE